MFIHATGQTALHWQFMILSPSQRQRTDLPKDNVRHHFHLLVLCFDRRTRALAARYHGRCYWLIDRLTQTNTRRRRRLNTLPTPQYSIVISPWHWRNSNWCGMEFAAMATLRTAVLLQFIIIFFWFAIFFWQRLYTVTAKEWPIPWTFSAVRHYY